MHAEILTLRVSVYASLRWCFAVSFIEFYAFRYRKSCVHKASASASLQVFTYPTERVCLSTFDSLPVSSHNPSPLRPTATAARPRVVDRCSHLGLPEVPGTRCVGVFRAALVKLR